MNRIANAGLFVGLLSAAVVAAQTSSANPKPGIPSLQAPFASLKPSATFKVGATADWVLAAGDSVWVAGSKPYSVQRIDPVTNRIIARIRLPGEACAGLASGFESIWVPVCGKKPMLARVDIHANRITGVLPIPAAGPEGGITAGGDSVWLVTDKNGTTLSRIDPATNTVRQTIAIPAGSYNPLSSGGTIWITGFDQNLLTAVDAASGDVLASIPVGPKPRFLAAGDGSVWTLNQGDGSLTRVDIESRKVTATVALGVPGPGGDLDVGVGFVWATAIDLPITAVDGATNRVRGQWVGRGGDSLRFGFDSVWVTDYHRGLLWRIPFKAMFAGAAAGHDSASSRGGYLLPEGWFSTRKAQIVDEDGHPVRIASVGLPGNDGTDGALRFLRYVNYQATMRGIVRDGFNAVRIAWCDLTLTSSPHKGVIDYELNPDLNGLSSMQVMDKIVNFAGTLGLRVIFDHHTNDGGPHGWGGQQTNGLWFDKGPGSDGTDGSGNAGTVTDGQFRANTLALVKRYRDNPAVIGYDLDNEPLSSGAGGVSLNWGNGGPTDIWKMYTELGNDILAQNPRLLIICEGPQSTKDAGNGLAGIGPEGDLSAVGGVGGAPARPVVLKVPNQVIYSVHEYDTKVYDYGANERPASLIEHMNKDWGYLYTKSIAPVWVGEMGSSLKTAGDRVWAQTLLDYMNGRFGEHGGPVFKGSDQPVSGSWWLWGYFQGEQPDGTLDRDWASPRADQQHITDKLLYMPRERCGSHDPCATGSH